MKKTFLPLALLAVLPLASCASLSDTLSKTKAGLNDGDVVEETTNSDTTVEENEYVALFNKLSADDYLSISQESIEGDYTYKTTISWEDLSLSISYKEVVKEDKDDSNIDTSTGDEDSTGDDTSGETNLQSEGKGSYHRHGHGHGHGHVYDKKDNKTRYEGELVYNESTYSVKGKSEVDDGVTEFEFKFALSETSFGELEYVLSQNYKEFYYEEVSAEGLSKAYGYSLYTSDEFTYAYAVAFDSESFTEVLTTKFVFEETTYLSVDSYVNETETHVLGKLVTLEDGSVSFEEVTFPEPSEDDKDDDKGCDCDCDCCKDHHKDDDHDDFDYDDFDYDDYDHDEDDFDYDDDHEGFTGYDHFGHGDRDNGRDRY